MTIRPPTPAAADRAGKNVGHRFYIWIAGVVALLVFSGFAPSFYLRGLSDAHALPAVLRIHGFLSSGWILLFLCQTILVGTGRTAHHRRLGVAGLILLVAMTVSGVQTAIYSSQHAPASVVGLDGPVSGLASTLVGLGIFVLFAAAGILYRRNKQMHNV
jgi:hypothetical protein